MQAQWDVLMHKVLKVPRDRSHDHEEIDAHGDEIDDVKSIYPALKERNQKSIDEIAFVASTPQAAWSRYYLALACLNANQEYYPLHSAFDLFWVAKLRRVKQELRAVRPIIESAAGKVVQEAQGLALANRTQGYALAHKRNYFQDMKQEVRTH